MKTSADKLPLHLAVEINSIDMVELLLEYKYPENMLLQFKDDEANVTYKFAFDLNALNNLGFSALHTASERGAKEIVQYFVEFKIKPESSLKNRVLYQRQSPSIAFSFDTASRSVKGEANMKAKGVYHPIKVNLPGRNGYTPLHAAVKRKFKDIAYILLTKGADVNVLANESGEEKSPLMMACENGDIAILGNLLSNGADDLNKKVFRYAVDRQPQMVQMLLRYRTIKDTTFFFFFFFYVLRFRLAFKSINTTIHLNKYYILCSIIMLNCGFSIVRSAFHYNKTLNLFQKYK